jgi:hypothetical protein
MCANRSEKNRNKLKRRIEGKFISDISAEIEGKKSEEEEGAY